MIIPTPQYDARFAFDGIPFSAKMAEYIRQEFADSVDPVLLAELTNSKPISASHALDAIQPEESDRKAA